MVKEFRKYNKGKLRYDLLPVEALEAVVDVLTYGAEKYTVAGSSGDSNWKNCPDIDNVYYAAALRHIMAWRKGETTDSESTRHHLAHAMCCLIFILQTDLEKIKNTKRNK